MTEKDIEKSAKMIVDYFGEESASILKAMNAKPSSKRQDYGDFSQTMSDEQKKRIASDLAKDVSAIDFKEDETIMGGIIIRIGDKV
jgi:hypothetical protein